MGSSFDMIDEHFLRIYQSSGRFSVSARLERLENLKIILLFHLFLLLFIGFIIPFNIIYKFHYLILINFYVYLLYF